MEFVNPPVPEGINSDARNPLRDFFLRGGMAVGIFASACWLWARSPRWPPPSFPFHGKSERSPVFPRFAARRVCILMAFSFVYRIMVYHGIHIPCTDQKAKTRPAEDRYAIFIMPIGLRYDSHSVAV